MKLVTEEKIIGYYGIFREPIIMTEEGKEYVCTLYYYNPETEEPVCVACQSNGCGWCDSEPGNYRSGCHDDPELKQFPTGYFY